MDTNESQIEVPPTTPEVPKIPQVEQVKPIDHLGQEAALTALREITPNVPDRPDLVQLAGAEPVLIDFGDDFDKTPIVGGEIISSTAIRVEDQKNADGSVSSKEAQERGWMSAIVSANAKEGLTLEEKSGNVQEIVDNAKEEGVPIETIKTQLEALGIGVVKAERETSAEPAMEHIEPATETTIPIEQNKSEVDLKKQQIRSEMQMLLKKEWESSKQRGMDLETFLFQGCRAKTMYDNIHSVNGPTHQEMDVNYLSNPDFSDFEKTIENRLVEAATSDSNVRHISSQELRDLGQPDQAEHFVWFKGNTPRPENAREVRFYINAKPESVTQVAQYLGKMSDACDGNNMRLQFKFRKDLDEYNRSDTCVAYLYLPEGKTVEEQQYSDQWINLIGDNLASNIPKDALRPNNSMFTKRLGDGVSCVDDTRDSASKKGTSYTNEIADTIGRAGMELKRSGVGSMGEEEVLNYILDKSVVELDKKGYFK